MLWIKYLQMFISVLILAGVFIKLSSDAYKTRSLQKNRNGILKSNWKIPDKMIQKADLKFDKSEMLFIDK